MAFHDVRLPDEVEQGATGGPAFQTTIIPLTNGGEQRNQDWEEVRHEWELSYGVQDKQDFDVVRSFFFARRGRSNTFRFKDWSDFELVDEVQGIGDGVNRNFQLIKVYEDGGPSPYFRRITRPVGIVVFKVNGVAVGKVDNGLGLYTLAVAPADGAVVTATCEFDMCVRFDTDKFALQLSQATAGAIGSLPVIEVRE
jgi:uncharacterized protein (TIGR02217 family)